MPELNVKKNITLAPFTSFKIGGPAKFFCEVSDKNELKEALDYGKKNKLEIFILGGGNNILVSDKGFDGLVVKLKAKNEKLKIKVQNSKFFVECFAGNDLSKVINFCKNNSLAGLEWAVGIPGTIGGTVRGNAGAFGGQMSDKIESVRVLDKSGLNSEETWPIVDYDRPNCQFAYRNSIFKKNKNLIIISCVLNLEKGDKGKIERKIKEIIEKRSQSYPRESSAGCFFQNPIVKNSELVAKFEKDAGAECREEKIPAGWLIEEADLAGKKIGGAAVSAKHKNFIINTGDATAEDIVLLTSLIKTNVRDKLGVELKEEVQYVGF